MTADPLPDPFPDQPVPAAELPPVDWGIPDTPPEPVAPAPDPPESFETAQPAHLPISGTRELPHSHDVEEGFLGACLLDATETADHGILAGLTPNHFYDAGHASIWHAIQDLRRAGHPVDVTLLLGRLGRDAGDIGGATRLSRLAAAAPTTALAPTYLNRILELRTRREIIRDAAHLAELARNPDHPIVETAAAAISSLQRVQEPGRATLRDRYTARQFSPLHPPVETPPRFSILGRPVSSAGNLTNLIAQAKAGKTAYTAAIIAAAMVAQQSLEGRDCLGVTAEAPGGRVLLHIDTEQSPHDHDQVIRLAMRRAEVSDAPKWLWSFGLAGFDARDLRAAFEQLLTSAAAQGGLHSIILDGSGDFVQDVNDPAECNAFVAQLHGLAIQHCCPIISVVHENPGQEMGKMRGHLGSQLERKAESNLRLKKSDETTVVFSEKMRRAPILEKEGPRFRWDTQHHMHRSIECAGDVRNDAKREKLRDLAQAVFEAAQKPRLRYGDFLQGIRTVRSISASTAEDRFADMKRFEVITKELATGMWELCDR